MLKLLIATIMTFAGGSAWAQMPANLTAPGDEVVLRVSAKGVQVSRST